MARAWAISSFEGAARDEGEDRGARTLRLVEEGIERQPGFLADEVQKGHLDGRLGAGISDDGRIDQSGDRGEVRAPRRRTAGRSCVRRRPPCRPGSRRSSSGPMRPRPIRRSRPDSVRRMTTFSASCTLAPAIITGFFSGMTMGRNFDLRDSEHGGAHSAGGGFGQMGQGGQGRERGGGKLDSGNRARRRAPGHPLQRVGGGEPGRGGRQLPAVLRHREPPPPR